MHVASAASKPWLVHEDHKVPVTALALLHGVVVLAGEGTLLNAYSRKSGKRMHSLRVFKSQAIHGILIRDDSILVWGGHLARAALLQTGYPDTPESAFFQAGDIANVGDWILDVSLGDSPSERESLRAYFVTAHNALVRCDLALDGRPGSTYQSRTTHLAHGSNCILYSAHITWLSASICLIASGTAFGDIIVWSCDFEEDGDRLRAQSHIHYTFSAHEGSVFGVRLSSLLRLPGQSSSQRLLASCSDDRTIRVWDVSDLSVQSASLTQVQQETGFGAKDHSAVYAPTCLAKVMAHLSRIWAVQFSPPLETNVSHEARSNDASESKRTLLTSFGEDASCIDWIFCENLYGPNQLPFSLAQVRMLSPHAGKNIWSSAVCEGGYITGGADGAINILSQMGETLQLSEQSRLPVCDAGARINFKAYTFLDSNILVATTTEGAMVRVSMDAAYGDLASDVVSVAEPLPGLCGYSVVAGVGALAFAGGYDGRVYAYGARSCGAIAELCCFDSKISGIFACSSTGGDATVLVTAVTFSVAAVVQLEETGGLFAMKRLANLALPAGRVATSFIIIGGDMKDIVVIGTRDGSVAGFTLADLDSDTVAETLTVSNTLLRSAVHKREAVTALHFHPSSHRTADGGFLYSTGRDGTCAVHSLVQDADGIQMELVHQLTLSFGPNIEGIKLSPEDHLWVWGFRSKHFVMYDATAQRELMSVECGGAHRNWAFNPSADGGTFVWTKASQFHKHVQDALLYQTVNGGGHGREIKCCAVSAADKQLIATGAEDTNIKIFTYDETGLTCLHTLRKHNTGIQHLAWSSDGSYLFSSGGFEEFCIWRTTQNVPALGVGVVCESQHPNGGASDLRVVGFDVREHHEGAPSFEFGMCYSDSTLKLWCYREGIWRLLGQGDYLTSCLTQSIRLSDERLTFATDGHIAYWGCDPSGDVVWTERHKVHQNAILTTARQRLLDGSNLIFTGGDDNAIGLTHCRRGRPTGSLIVPGAHAAAVTGLSVFAQGSPGRFWLVSVGIDQCVMLWEVSCDCSLLGADAVHIERLAREFTSVADVSSMSAIELADGGRGVVVCGVGMEILRLPAAGTRG